MSIGTRIKPKVYIATFYMKKLFLMAAVAVATSALFSACTESSNENNDPAAEIKITKTSITASADKSEYTIGYTITGGGSEKTKIASATSSDDEWLIVEEENANSILIGVTENESAESRTGTITLSYNGAPDVYVIVLQSGSQKAQVDANMHFNIDISAVDAWSVSFTIKPTTQSTYYYGVVDKRTYDKYGAEFAISQYVEFIRTSIAMDPTYTVEDFLAQGTEKQEFEHLWSMTDYYIVAFDLNAGYKSSGNVTVKEFTTDVVAPSANYFTITADGAKINVKPRSATMKYLFDAVDIEYFSQFPMIYYLAYDCMDRLNQKGVIQQRLTTGETNYDFSAELDTDQFDCFVAFAFESDGIYDFQDPGLNEKTITYIKFYYDPSSSTARISETSQSVRPKTFIGKTIEK